MSPELGRAVLRRRNFSREREQPVVSTHTGIDLLSFANRLRNERGTFQVADSVPYIETCNVDSSTGLQYMALQNTLRAYLREREPRTLVSTILENAQKTVESKIDKGGETLRRAAASRPPRPSPRPRGTPRSCDSSRRKSLVAKPTRTASAGLRARVPPREYEISRRCEKEVAAVADTPGDGAPAATKAPAKATCVTHTQVSDSHDGEVPTHSSTGLLSASQNTLRYTSFFVDSVSTRSPTRNFTFQTYTVVGRESPTATARWSMVEPVARFPRSKRPKTPP